MKLNRPYMSLWLKCDQLTIIVNRKADLTLNFSRVNHTSIRHQIIDNKHCIVNIFKLLFCHEHAESL